MKNKAVILGANYYIGLSAIRCLGENGVWVTAVDYQKEGAYGLESKYLKEICILPNYREQEAAFIEGLIHFAKAQEAKPVLMPCADPYVEVTDKHRDLLMQYYLMPGMPQGLQTSLLEKDALAAFCRQHDVKIPETLTLETIDTQGMEALLAAVDEQIGYPCLLKPVNSHAFVAVFRRKMFRAESREELVAAIEKAKAAGLEMMIQRIIPGFDDHMYTYDAHLNEGGKVTHWLTCQKYRQYPINFGASVYTGQKYVPELHDIGGKFLEAVGYKGFAEIEFKKDAKTGDYYLIEVNTRYSNLNVLVKQAGLNMPYITYRELVGDPVPEKAITKNTGLVFWYAYEDFFAVKGYVKSGQLTLSSVLMSYLQPKAYAIWDPQDPKPFFGFLKLVLGKATKRLSR